MPSEKGRKSKSPNVRRTRKTGNGRKGASRDSPRTVRSHGTVDRDHPILPPGSVPHLPVEPAWSADSAGVYVQRDETTGQVRSLSHPGRPYVAGDASTVTNAELLEIASGYLRVANDVLGISEAWLDALEGHPGPIIFPDWMPFDGDPRHSFRSARTNGDGDVLDEVAVVVAVLCVGAPGKRYPLYGGQGISVTMHIDRVPDDGPRFVRVTGVTSSLPVWDDAKLATAPAAAAQALTNAGLLEGGTIGAVESIFLVLGEFIARGAGLPPGTTFTDYRFRLPSGGIEIPGGAERVELLVKSIADASSGNLSYEVTATFSLGGAPGDMEIGSPVPLVTFATAPAQVFVQDPVTRNGAAAFKATRPNRDSPSLDPSRTAAQLRDVQPTLAANQYLLTDGTSIDVVNSFLAPGTGPGTTFLYDSTVAYPSRTDTQSAVNAYFHFHELILRMTRYGLSLPGFFKFVTRPVQVTYRGGVLPGSGDGKTVNAQVRWRIRPTPTTSPGIGPLDISLAMADLALNARKAPLGIACDPRWLWHEFGHMLLAAATGSLELPFAHSVGDAISAIEHDPGSALATPAKWRGLTFPWVTIPGRRHDREAKDGWSWSGTFNGRERDFAPNAASSHRGYWTEQLLSSSLFRMYRALGGDACVVNAGAVVPDWATRRIAADHAIFLIIRAIEVLGSSTGTSAATPELFVKAIMDADAGASTIAPPPTVSAATPPRLGGFAQKVSRWAFEMQGGFPTPFMRFPHNGPGAPPQVDIYIDSGSPTSRRGGYAPLRFVNGDWHTRPSELWIRHAAIGPAVNQPPKRNKDNFVFVRVRNRGSVDAGGVTVAMYVAKLVGGAIPLWPGTAWRTLALNAGGVGIANVVKAPGATEFGPFVWKPTTAGTYALFAIATCHDDRANTDPATLWASAVAPVPQPLALRVACDNNLAVRTEVVA
jgi:hypothetical protein